MNINLHLLLLIDINIFKNFTRIMFIYRIEFP